jgi:hypothetical protein
MPDEKAMGFEDDLHRIDEHLAEARRMAQRQKGLIIRLQAAGVSTWDAQRILWLIVFWAPTKSPRQKALIASGATQAATV